VLEELPVCLHVGGKAVEVIEAAHIHPSCRKALGLVLQRRTQLWRGLIPLGLVVSSMRCPSGSRN
jgi:hypothetical protein